MRLHDLLLKSYRISVVHKLCLGDAEKHVRYCEWLLESVTVGVVDPLQYFVTDEAWFHLSGYVNSRNSWYWATENRYIIHNAMQSTLMNTCKYWTNFMPI
jgi:hypothetical protein